MSKRDKILLVILLVVVIGTIIIIYFNFIKKETGNGIIMPEDFEQFELPDIDDLKEHGNLPIDTGPTGRSNPFDY